MVRRFAVFLLVVAAVAFGFLVWGIVEVGEATIVEPDGTGTVAAPGGD